LYSTNRGIVNYLFIDLETTGLERTQDYIVELGMVVTNHLFVPVDTFNVVIGTNHEHWKNSPDIVMDMHRDNGLFQESSNSTVSLEEAEQIASWWVQNNRWLGPQPVMCGNTVHFDRDFLRYHMPLLQGLFHYRNFDVSTLKQMLLAVLPDFDFIPDMKDEIHRAIPDCLEAAALAGEFLELFASVLQSELAQRNLLSRVVRREG
jgi:oligoribonuclease